MELVDIKKNGFKLNLTEEFESKIRWWCSRLPDNEWSGVMFYRTQGSFDDLRKPLHITAVDFIVLDIGTGGHTEFDESAEIISYKTENDLLDCRDGLIHSHNRMNAFFSGEDSSTLIKEGTDRNHFLSLVVNNAGNYVAAITRHIVSEYICSMSTYGTFDGKIVHNNPGGTVKTEYIEKFDLAIDYPDGDRKRYNELVSKPKPAAVSSTWNYKTPLVDKTKEPTLFDTNDKPKVKNNPDDDLFPWETGDYTVDSMVAFMRIMSGCINPDMEWFTGVDPTLCDLFRTDKKACGKYINLCVDGLDKDDLEDTLEMASAYEDDGDEYVQYAIEIIKDKLRNKKK